MRVRGLDLALLVAASVAALAARHLRDRERRQPAGPPGIDENADSASATPQALRA